MTLKAPFSISSRLLPCLSIGGASIQLEYSNRPGSDGRTRYYYTLDLPGGITCQGHDQQSGCQGGNLQEGFESLLSFLCACGESYSSRMRRGETEIDQDSNESLFPGGIPEFCYQFSDEISMLLMEIQEAREPLIVE